VRRKAEGDRRETAVIFKSKLGWAGVAATEKGISGVILPMKDKKAVERQLEFALLRTTNSAPRTFVTPAPALGRAVKFLQEYFSGGSVLFDLPLDVRRHTAFQQAVWRATSRIPYGETRSYAWIAKRIRKPLASRAVGRAIGANPLPIIIP
jgi:O6-methylguanine-DNA--protein-cysteine methyltransferase